MKRIFFALVALLSLGSFAVPAYSDGNAATPISVGTIANNLAAHNWQSYEWISFCGYNACADQGGGIFHKESCTPDGIFCIADGAGNSFARQDAAPGGVFDGHKGGLWEDGVHDDTTALNATLTAAVAHGVEVVALCGQTLAPSADIVIPNSALIDGCAEPPGLAAGNYTFASGLQGVLAHGPVNTIHGSVRNMVIERSGDSLSPTTFVAVSTRDALNAAAAMAGTGVVLDSPAAQLNNVLILGFNQGVAVSTGAAGSAGSHIHGDDTNGISFNGLGSGVSFADVGFQSFLTHGTVAVGPLDNVLTSGTNYKAVIAILPTDTASTIALKTGDTIYVSVSPNGGAQSLGDVQTLSCSGTGGACATVPNGTDGCVSATTCQEAVIAGSSVTPVTMNATWTAGTQSNGVAYPMVVSSIDGLAVGQGISTSGACTIAANVIIKDVFQIGDTFFVTPSVPNTCAGTSQSVTFSDGATVAGVFTAAAFTHDGRGVEVSGVQRHGNAAYIANGGGAQIDGFNGYTHDIAINCDTGGSNTRFTNLALGLNDPLGDHGNIGIWIHGDHTGNDCDNFEAVKGEASQHITRPIVVDSDGTKLDRFGFLNIGPAPGRSSGTALDMVAGRAVFSSNTAKNAGNVKVADYTTYHVVHPDNKHLGTGYTAHDVVTATGGTSCSPQGALTIDRVDGSGIPLTWHQSVQGVCATWPTNPITTTGGAGTGLKLDTDGQVAAQAVVTGNDMPITDFYVQTPTGTAFFGANNVCVVLAACNDIRQLGSPTLIGGVLYPTLGTAIVMKATSTISSTALVITSGCNAAGVGLPAWSAFTGVQAKFTAITCTGDTGTATLSLAATVTEASPTQITAGRTRYDPNSAVLANSSQFQCVTAGSASQGSTTWVNDFFWGTDVACSTALLATDTNGQKTATFGLKTSDDAATAAGQDLVDLNIIVNDDNTTALHSTHGAYIEMDRTSGATTSYGSGLEISYESNQTCAPLNPYIDKAVGHCVNLTLDNGVGLSAPVPSPASEAMRCRSNSGVYQTCFVINDGAIDVGGGPQPGIELPKNVGIGFWSTSSIMPWHLYSDATTGANTLKLHSTSLESSTKITAPQWNTTGNVSQNAWLDSGVIFASDLVTVTDLSSSGTVAKTSGFKVVGPIFAASNATTYTVASTMALTGPTAGANVTIGTGYALDVESGNVIFEGAGTVTNLGLTKLSGATAVNKPALTLDGAILTGSTGTGNVPADLISPTGTTAVSSWNTSGTGLGMNMANAFAGNFLDFHVNGGASLFSVSSAGLLTAASYAAGATAGVTCSGAPTGSFASTLGIVTHC